MPWTCRLLPWDEWLIARDSDALRPGDMAEMPSDRAAKIDGILSDEYRRDWQGRRRPILVALPGGAIFNLDRFASGSGRSGWTITGAPPRLTATPSINCEGVWHGYLTGGVLTEDCESRRFDDDGRRL